METKTLSDEKITKMNLLGEPSDVFYLEEDVKQFIKDLIEDLDKDYKSGDIGMIEYHRRMDNLIERAGKELTDGN